MWYERVNIHTIIFLARDFFFRYRSLFSKVRKQQNSWLYASCNVKRNRALASRKTTAQNYGTFCEPSAESPSIAESLSSFCNHHTLPQCRSQTCRFYLVPLSTETNTNLERIRVRPPPGGNSTKFGGKGGSVSRSNPLPFSETIFDRLDTPFVYLLLRCGNPFVFQARTLHPC